ncbi:MAG: glycogen synthase [Elusimicrobiota bacterium]
MFAAGEAVPFCKTGGLADVAGALPRVLAAKGSKVSLFLPYYRAVAKAGFNPSRVCEAKFMFDGSLARVPVRRWAQGPFDAYFIEHPGYFDRDGLYGEGGRDYLDGGVRFAFFSRAVLEAAKVLKLEPDIVHAHDWQTGLIPACLRLLYKDDAALSKAACFFTIHNAAYQGVFSKDLVGTAGLPPSEFTPEKLEFYGQLNYLKAGAVYADRLTTVSPTYAREIQSSAEFGRGLEGIYRGRGESLAGILNGLDLELWNPLTDASLPRRYGSGGWKEGKAACKALLRRKCGFGQGEGPLMGMVARMDRQKGLDLLPEVLPRFIEKGAQFVLVALGDPELERLFKALEARYPRRVHCHASFDDPFARLTYAACDLFLMPSRFEPCGLGQMIAMRYGAVPVAARTGGLADTVFENPDQGRKANGFLADEPTAKSLSSALERACAAFSDPAAWSRRVDACMAEDLSWQRSAQKYLSLYQESLKERRS